MGKMFGKYELVEQLGRGGMAEVWKAKIHGIAGFERTLVVKRILPQLVRDEEFVAMFVREAQLGSMLSHTNIVQVYELGELDGEYYMAMEYVRGRDLHAVMRARPLEPPPVGLAALAGRDICRALGYAHALTDERGAPLRLVHRDVTPSNVMLSVDGVVKLVDFGVAKALAKASSQLTAAGSIKGKLSYMSPEQMTGGTVDHRTDLFACGVSLHETLTGRRLFKGEDDEETIYKVLQAPIHSPAQLNPAVPRELDLIVMKALERDPNRRFQSGEEMADALDVCVHKLKWSAAQVAALLQERFPELKAPSSSGPIDVHSRRQASNAFADLPTAFAPTQIGAPSSSPPREQTGMVDRGLGTQQRRTLSLVRAVEQMGAWTGDDRSSAPLDPGPTRVQIAPAPLPAIPTATDARPPRRDGRRKAPNLRWTAVGAIIVFTTVSAMYLVRRPRSPAVESLPPAPPPTSELAPSPTEPRPSPARTSRQQKAIDDALLAPKISRGSRSQRSRGARPDDPAKPASSSKSSRRSRPDVERGDVINPF